MATITQKGFNKELEKAFDKFSNRQYFIGITEDGVCVRCLYLRLWTGRWVLDNNDIWDGEAVKEYSHNVFILERGFSDKRIVGVK